MTNKVKQNISMARKFMRKVELEYQTSSEIQRILADLDKASEHLKHAKKLAKREAMLSERD